MTASLDHPRPGPSGDTADRAAGGTEIVLSAQELAALHVLYGSAGRVVSRRELARQLGIADRNERRCDSLLVGLRRAMGPEAIVTVRSRGWMLAPDRIALAQRQLARTGADAAIG